MNVGIFVPNWIGDVVMATPTLRALRNHFGPQARLTGILRPYVAEVLAGTSWLDDYLFYKPGAKQADLRTQAVVKKLRQQQFDWIVLLTNSFRTSALAWASGARERVGYVRYGRGLLLTRKLYPPRQGFRRLPMPLVNELLQLAYAAGCPWESPQLELATLPADEAAADAVWKKLRLPPGEQVVVFNSGGAYGAAKHWPTEYFAQLARRLARHDGLSVLVNCGPSERTLAAEIVRQADHPQVVSLAAEEVPIGLSKACIRRSRLLVTTDSGPRFFAVAFQVPVVSLFGPTNADWTRTYFPGENCLSVPVPCGPCMRRVCPLGHHQCMRNMTMDMVYAAVQKQLEFRRPVFAA